MAGQGAAVPAGAAPAASQVVCPRCGTPFRHEGGLPARVVCPGCGHAGTLQRTVAAGAGVAEGSAASRAMLQLSFVILAATATFAFCYGISWAVAGRQPGAFVIGLLFGFFYGLVAAWPALVAATFAMRRWRAKARPSLAVMVGAFWIATVLPWGTAALLHKDGSFLFAFAWYLQPYPLEVFGPAWPMHAAVVALGGSLVVAHSRDLGAGLLAALTGLLSSIILDILGTPIGLLCVSLAAWAGAAAFLQAEPRRRALPPPVRGRIVQRA